mmetsp:Transcript_110612/g.268806  ORF Transcript_110612/g.268806 Transcript_110612/m.268806 type:complete len:148 (-) Transcript_110612:179-622(-)
MAASSSSSDDHVNWQWLGPRGSWQDFKPNAVQQLEAACRNGKTTCKVQTPAGEVAVNFQSMLQRQVAGASAPRKVRRLVADVEQLPTVQASGDAGPRSLSPAELTAISERLSQGAPRGSAAALRDAAPRGAAKAKAKAAAKAAEASA